MPIYIDVMFDPIDYRGQLRAQPISTTELSAAQINELDAIIRTTPGCFTAAFCCANCKAREETENGLTISLVEDTNPVVMVTTCLAALDFIDTHHQQCGLPTLLKSLPCGKDPIKVNIRLSTESNGVADVAETSEDLPRINL